MFGSQLIPVRFRSQHKRPDPGWQANTIFAEADEGRRLLESPVGVCCPLLLVNVIHLPGLDLPAEDTALHILHQVQDRHFFIRRASADADRDQFPAIVGGVRTHPFLLLVDEEGPESVATRPQCQGPVLILPDDRGVEDVVVSDGEGQGLGFRLIPVPMPISSLPIHLDRAGWDQL